MQYIFGLLCFIFILITSGCSGDDPVSSVPADTKLIHSQEVGLSGGTINLENVVIDIPSGAFNDNNQICRVSFKKSKLDLD